MTEEEVNEKLQKKIRSVKGQSYVVRELHSKAHKEEKVLLKKKFELAKMLITTFPKPNKYFIVEVETRIENWMDFTDRDLEFFKIPNNFKPNMELRDIFFYDWKNENKISDLKVFLEDVATTPYLLLIDKKLNQENLLENTDIHIFSAEFFMNAYKKERRFSEKDLFKY